MSMIESMSIIKTKLLVPAVKEESLRRAKLTRKMKAISQHPLTLMHSGAGYGKSTALALFVQDEKKECCWYSISSADDEILPFLTYLIYSIRTRFPEFGRELFNYIKNLERYIREEELGFLSSLFINELLGIEEEIYIILDDFHQIEHSYTVNSWMERVLEHIPANVHILISSRSRPAWKQLTKMKVSNRLLEFTKDDLILTKDEAELLLHDYYNLKVREEELNRIFELTEGWVIAIGMIAQQIPEEGDLQKIYSHSSQSLADLFQYLVMEVFAKQPPILQQFLEQTCIFEEIDEEICDAVLGLNGSAPMLEQLLEKNLFIYRIGDKQYRYHALFKEFLENQLKINNPHTFRSLHERSARYFERNKQWEEALNHYEKINVTEAVASILDALGFSMLENGKLESLYSRLLAIPDRDKDRFYSLWRLQGEILRYRCQYQEAEVCYEKAVRLADEKGDAEEKSQALGGQAGIYLDTIQPYKAERILYRAIEIREKKAVGHAEETGKLYHFLAENLLNSGKAEKAEKWIKRASDMNVPLINGNLEARLYLRTGRFEKAKKILEKDLGTNDVHKPLLPQSHRETELLLALIEAFTGNGTNAKTLAQEGIQHGISIKAPFVEACGWIRMGHAVQLIKDYEETLALSCYNTALGIMDQLQIERGKAEPLMGLCLLYGIKGELERAIAAGESALQETEKVKDLWLSGLILTSMGIAHAYNARPEDGLSYFQRAAELFGQCGDHYGEMLSSFWRAYSYFTMENQEQFVRYMALFLKAVQTGEYEFVFHRNTTFGPRDLQIFAPLLIHAQKQNILPSYVAKILQEMNLAKVNSHPGYTLKVQALGKFRVWLGETEVEEKGWTRGKAKELLQFFVTHHQKLIPKEEIFQLLWPEQDEKSSARDFKVALNALNNVLEPNRKARETSFFIIREGSAYGLNPIAVLDLDSHSFEQWITSGLEETYKEKAVHYLENGLSLYKGDYLPERKYDDWCMSEREKMSVYFIRGAEKLAQFYVRAENYDKAIHLCSRILEKDRTWEEAYRLTMYCYYRKNNRPQAIKWYKKCCDILEKELGVAPLEPTRHMYEMILESDKNMHILEQP
ncbi:BTAD domain-containing putative transcriptional regulator [Aeromicrobium ponti]|uniref:Transcriptional activator n=1 Tax=Cytobacillus oceanisediminis TaxID=665099 RepID=A0A562JPJ5_9BACI|nr:BTAD domain-containing putative transcriptional regulator [Cytobacillus oceanisediminis]TWH85089.1 transcriptional activator [Cytobacillus oceanisediminis]